MKRGTDKHIKRLIVLVSIILTTSLLYADFEGDQARAGAATKAAQVAFISVTKFNQEIALKRSIISQAESLFSSLSNQYNQFKNKIAAFQKQAIDIQQLVKATQDKTDALIKKANQKIQAIQPLLTIFQQANALQEINEAHGMITKLNGLIEGISTLAKTAQSNLEKIRTAAAQLEGK